MSLRVSGKNMDIGSAFRTHIESRIDAALAKYKAVLVSGHVTVEREGSGFHADCTLHLSSGATLQADAKAHEPYIGFNRAADLIENQIRRHRQRLIDRHNGTVAENRAAIERVASQSEPARNGEEVLAETGTSSLELHPAVIAEPPSGYKEMTVSGAAMELDATNAHVVVFRRASDGRTNVVYRRPDGNIGWIDPSRER